MASTLTNLLYHVVFSTKGRIPLISDEIKEPLYRYMSGIIRNQDGKTIDMLRAIKSDSSGWLNHERPGDRFAWQTGYGAFTVSQSQIENVRQYIRTQEEHHRERSFKTELLSLLKNHGVEYDERYLWD